MRGICQAAAQFQKERGKMFVHPRNNLHHRERSHRPPGFLHGINASYQIKDTRPKKKLRGYVRSIQRPVFPPLGRSCKCMTDYS
jgi:hypothetical protein